MNIRELIAELYGPELLFLDEEVYDHAILGVCQQGPSGTYTVLYDAQAVVETLVKNGCELQEAWEFFHFNIVGSWLGEYTPTFLYPYLKEELSDPT